jgi:glycosyltransferase involved in cell wall biosynthesis
MRLAWFTPLEPVRSGIASYSAMILPHLAAAHEIDVFVDVDVWRARAAGATRDTDGYWLVETLGCRVRSAHDFLPRHLVRPYELTIYQLGNARCHDYMWPYLVRYPGLLVLHDWQVHHARARALLANNRTSDYRAEFAACHPDAQAGVADWIISGFGNMAAYLWPLTGLAVRASRAVAVHYPRAAADLSAIHPDTHVLTIRHGAPDLQERMGASGHERMGEKAITFAAFGLITPEKRIPQILRALAAIRSIVPHVRLRLVGDMASHYDVREDAERLGVADLVEVTGFVTDEAFDREILSSDVCLCLRWPTNREASGPWLRCLAAGKPTVVIDLAHLVDVATLDPRTWEVIAAREDGASALTPPRQDEAVAVSLDILDEDHSLAIAMRRLALDAPLRDSLGSAARRLWTADHTLASMAADYEHALAAAVDLAPPDPATRGLPPHLLADGTAGLRRLAAEVGAAVDFLDAPR